MSDASNTNTALLVQLLDQMGAVREDIGGVKSQLEHGTRRFESIDEQLETIGAKQKAIESKLTTTLDPLVASVPVIEKKVNWMETFLGKKLAPIVAVSSTVVAVALWLIAISIGTAFTWAKANLSDHLHWSEWHVTAFAFVCAFLPGYSRSGPPPSVSPPPWTPPVVRDLHDEPDGES